MDPGVPSRAAAGLNLAHVSPRTPQHVTRACVRHTTYYATCNDEETPVHTPEPNPRTDPEEPDTEDPPVPPDMDPVVPVEEPPKPGRAPGDLPPLIAAGAQR